MKLSIETLTKTIILNNSIYKTQKKKVLKKIKNLHKNKKNKKNQTKNVKKNIY